jgi:hypothetical protein
MLGDRTGLFQPTLEIELPPIYGLGLFLLYHPPTLLKELRRAYVRPPKLLK